MSYMKSPLDQSRVHQHGLTTVRFLIGALITALVACGGGDGNAPIPAVIGSANSTTPVIAPATNTAVNPAAVASGTTAVTPTPVSTTPVTTVTTGLLLTGITFPLKLNDSVHVPAGAQLTMPNGIVSTLSGSTGTYNVPGGTMITVPSTATGAATVLIVSLSNVAINLPNTLPTVEFVAGSATQAGPPTDGLGEAARFWGDSRMATNRAGDLFITDGAALKSVSAAGDVKTVSAAYSPYDWQAIAFDADGTIYGGGNSYAPPPNAYGASLQSMSVDGALTTVLENWAVSATISTLGNGGIVVDSAKNIYVADTRNNRILKVNSKTGTWAPWAGSGAVGATNAVGVLASFNAPNNLAIDAAGNVYASDVGNAAIRKITPAGTVSTLSKQASLGAITSTWDGVIYALAGSPRLVVRIDQNRGTTSAFPVPGAIDNLNGIVNDGWGHVYVQTQGTGSQIFRLSGI